MALNLPTGRVTVVDVDIPITSLMWLMIKWAIAAIPAAIFLAFIAALCAGLFTTVVALFAELAKQIH